MGLLSRDQLLKKEQLQRVQVLLGDDSFVFVRQLSGKERDEFERSLIREVIKDGEIVAETNVENFKAKLAVFVLCDEQGESILLPTDYEAFSRSISAAKLEMIINLAQELNRISDKDKAEMVKNFEAVQSGNSISDSVES